MGQQLESTLVNAALGVATGGISSLAGTAIGALSGAIFGNSQTDKNQQQINQQRELQNLQIQGSEQLTDYQRNSQLQYQQEQYKHQVEGMNEAGINPALMYGGGGGGGSTGGSVTPVQGSQAADTAQSTQADIARTMQLEQMKVMDSQANLNNSQAQKAQTEIPQVQASTENIKTSTALLAQQTNNAKIAEIGIALDNAFKAIQNNIAAATQEDIENKINIEVQNLQQQGRLLQTQVNAQTISNTTARATQEAVIENYNKQVELTISQTLQNKAVAGLDKTKADAIAQQLKQGWQELSIKTQGQEVSKENTEKMANAIMISAGISAGGNIVNTLVGTYLKSPIKIPLKGIK